jgi:hypothetical protein
MAQVDAAFPSPPPPRPDAPEPAVRFQAAPSGRAGRTSAEDELRARISEARQHLDRARELLAELESELRGVCPTHPGYAQLLSRLHILERCRFSRQLELDALLKEWRSATGRGAPSGR